MNRSRSAGSRSKRECGGRDVIKRLETKPVVQRGLFFPVVCSFRILFLPTMLQSENIMRQEHARHREMARKRSLLSSTGATACTLLVNICFLWSTRSSRDKVAVAWNPSMGRCAASVQATLCTAVSIIVFPVNHLLFMKIANRPG